MDLSGYISSAADYFGIPTDLFTAQLQQESSLGTNMGSIGNIGQVTQPALDDVNNFYGTNYTESDLAGSNQLGVDVAAAYDSLKYNQTGSYVGMLQAYGTLPSDPLNNTPSQSALSRLAQNYDIFGSGTMGAPVTNPSAPLSGIAGAANSAGITSAGLGNFFSFITSGAGWERIAVVVIGILLLGVAGFMLATKGFEGTVRTVAKAA